MATEYSILRGNVQFTVICEGYIVKRKGKKKEEEDNAIAIVGRLFDEYLGKFTIFLFFPCFMLQMS